MRKVTKNSKKIEQPLQKAVKLLFSVNSICIIISQISIFTIIFYIFLNSFFIFSSISKMRVETTEVNGNKGHFHKICFQKILVVSVRIDAHLTA